ncbi:SRPBCC family protein [Gulosibacter molinativorax]|uniref:SRPBCC family protein n=1 Tax=Gulosibacter molinativorax TaxID=256821 RepID=A0ABT7CA11_9MICO|nr:SRPBCC family protein [Gulosibacter molinativorax]MDJ1372041.1 SRPBCC family protein [Gulosibacter molinativorax]QUY63911.1 Hypotetical protein [Gulosibacter molinativorax]
MPQSLEASAIVNLTPDEAFALAHTLGADRISWDSHVEKRMLLRDARALDRGVQVFERVNDGRRLILEYDVWFPGQVSSNHMVKGPWWLADYGEGWHFKAVDGGTKVTWKITYRHAAPFLSEQLGAAMKLSFRTELDQRLADFVAASLDADLVQDAVSGKLPKYARHREAGTA